MKKRILKIINRFGFTLDYKIAGEYYEPLTVNGREILRKQYIRKYYLKRS